jgi:hypothetical protein
MKTFLNIPTRLEKKGAGYLEIKTFLKLYQLH